jgi:hypothetical protein
MAVDPETTQRPKRTPRATIIVLGVIFVLALLTLMFVWPKLASRTRSAPEPTGSMAPPAKQPAP